MRAAKQKNCHSWWLRLKSQIYSLCPEWLSEWWMKNEVWNAIQHSLHLAVLKLVNTINLTPSCQISRRSKKQNNSKVRLLNKKNLNPSCPEYFLQLVLSSSFQLGEYFLPIFHLHASAQPHIFSDSRLGFSSLEKNASLQQRGSQPGLMKHLAPVKHWAP